MTEGIRLRAFAKVNYALEVRGVRPDGYHEISTVLQSISLADEVEIKRAQRGFALAVEPEDAEVGAPQENTVYRAWARLREVSGEELPVRIRLRKQVPAGAGLGGGSADAAAVLVGLNALFGLGLDNAELRRVGLRVGVDVAFCIEGGTALGEGIGEILSPLPVPPSHYLVVARPAVGANTARIYRAYDERAEGGVPSVAPTVEALRAGDPILLARGVGNDLALVTESLVFEVQVLRGDLLRAGALGTAMSGTGTAVYGIFGSEVEAQAAKKRLQAHFATVCEPVAHGVRML
ncbi:MAG: 4-(cytidine 5'-diphospho)-2-C-methyl-D-erythritol kinase [Actinobacteria bacterium]|nr:4-(cytidine 5'-diphospho)-2-C-methyl-D-erythritol kinase [Actinomycetota bacterium]MCA1737568.1 4-(cytidine 5'-diphospho)-2-C-methyl-D-erythritol kinase [Actinomycetota bacterium]